MIFHITARIITLKFWLWALELFVSCVPAAWVRARLWCLWRHWWWSSNQPLVEPINSLRSGLGFTDTILCWNQTAAVEIKFHLNLLIHWCHGLPLQPKFSDKIRHHTFFFFFCFYQTKKDLGLILVISAWLYMGVLLVLLIFFIGKCSRTYDYPGVCKIILN